MANLLEEASILLTPTAYNDGKMLSVKPTNGDGDFIFTRNSAATRVNAQGLVDSVSENLPRINYEDGCGIWLLEPQSTNSITHSEDFSSTFYVKDSGVIVGNTNNISPSGEVNATKVNVTDNGRIYANMPSATYYSTVFIKAGTFSYFKFLNSNIDLVAETNSSGSIENYGNGWFRIGIAITSVRPFQIQAYPDNTYTNHTTTGSYYIWGAQAEQQSFATSYIPTQGAISTRLQDIATNSGNASLINSEEGVLYAETKASVNSGNITLSNGSNNDNLIISFNLSSGRIDCNMKAGGVYQFIFNYTTDMTINNKIAVRYKANDFSLFVNGIKVLTDTSGITPIANTFDRLNFSSANTAANYFYGKTKAIAVYKTALTDEQLTALTTI